MGEGKAATHAGGEQEQRRVGRREGSAGGSACGGAVAACGEAKSRPPGCLYIEAFVGVGDAPPTPKNRFLGLG